MSCNSKARFDVFVDRYNRERPHQALAMKVLGDLRPVQGRR
jgi:transposase InsO family protein